ncbi:MAG TPA: hypothetical protein VFG30_19050 [Polyangiales bacterium]|nr:hypothetical protein [Polyangiales bacterium]
MGRTPWLPAILVLACGCGSSLPPRYVIEHDLGPFAYRRYQKSLEVEVPIEGNPATGHTASYLRRGASDSVAVVTAFVTVYQKPTALAAEARAALENLTGYTLKPSELAGENVWVLEGPGRERWCVWVSTQRVVKIGVQPGQEFPEPVLNAYLGMYPSDLDEHGAANADAPSAGKAKAQVESDADELAVPRDLRENAPR